MRYLKRPRLNNPILIEGLPGVGNVGKLAAEHLIDELKAEKFAEIYSKHFPPQVFVGDDGVVRQVKNEAYYLKVNTVKNDLILIVGDYQGLTPEGQYELADAFLDLAEKFKVKQIFTLGGYGLGRLVDKPRVLGAATDKELVKEMKKLGVVFPKGEPGSGIIGASGLLLGLGVLRGMKGVCLMGETSGYFVDPKSAQAVLEVLSKILGAKIDLSKLERRAIQIDKIASQLKEMERRITESEVTDLSYIG